MRRQPSTVLAFTTIASLSVAATRAHADPVNVNNPGFEVPNVVDDNPNGGFDPNNDATGWFHTQSSGSHLSGVADPGVNQGPAFVGENNFAQLLMNYPGPDEPGGYAFFIQDISATVQPATRYTLSLTVGARADAPTPTVGNGDTTGAVFTHFGISGTANLIGDVATRVQSNAAPVAGGTTANWTLAWESGASPNPALLGKNLYIRLLANAESGVTAILFDNVSVDVTPLTAVWTGGTSGNWGDTGNWNINVVPTSYRPATFPSPVPGGFGSTVAVANGQSAQSVSFADNYTLTGGSLDTPSIDVAASKSVTVGSVLNGTAGLTKTGGGTLTLSSATTYTGGTTVSAGTLVAAHGDAFAGGALDVADGAIAQAQSSLSKALTISTLNTHSTGQLDITNNAMAVRGMNPADVVAAIISGFNGGAWNGPGINSSTAAADTNGLTAIGYAANSEYGATDFHGVTGLTSADVLVRYTYYGDADLDGQVTLDDFSQFLNGYQTQSAATNNWLNGDFDYDGAVTLDDFSQFLFGYQHQGAPLGALEGMIESSSLSASDKAMMLAAVEAVPEPTGLALVAVAGAGLLAGRRLRRR